MRLLRLTGYWLGVALVAFAPVAANAATLSALATFGGGDGWRSPNEILAGDTSASNNGIIYNYLGTANLERGLAYNAATKNLILVSRSTAGNGIRILDGTSGADEGSLNQGTGIITGGTFTTSVPAVTPGGVVYVANLASPLGASTPYKVYQWTSESAAAPTVAFSSTTVTTGRLGDGLDLIGDGASTLLVAGESASAGTGARNGYAVLSTADGTNFTGSLVTFTGTPPTAGDFRLGVTFAGSGSDVWGKQTGAGQNLELSSYAGTTGTSLGTVPLSSLGEAAIDYVVIKGRPFLAALDMNNSLLRIYDVTNPALPKFVISGTTTSGVLTGNGNATGNVKWGDIATDGTATIYAMSSNQGIQAFQVTGLPEPGSALLLVLGSLLIGGWRSRVIL